jgi:mannosyltransferase
MALPKSMRYLAAATLCIFVYLFVQLLHTSPTELHIPTGNPSASQHGQVDPDRDPQLDRTAPTPNLPCYVPC